MTTSDDNLYEEECENIRQERDTYKVNGYCNITKCNPYLKFFGGLSFLLEAVGFVALIAVPFTEITLLHATCFFVISYTVAPTDLDRSEKMIKGIAEDLGRIRANISVMRKKD